MQQQIEEALPFVVAKEVSVGSRTETLKAQSVIARTNLWGMYLKNQSDDAQGKRDWLEPGGTEDLMTLWGASAYEKNMEKFRQAVKETRGEILTVEHQPIQAAYHYAANCKTRNASEVPGQEAAVYLQSVDSPDDMLADGFLSISYMEKQQMADALASLFQEDAPQAENLPGALELTVRDSAGYVTEVTCGRTVANGEAVRQALHLNSACFYFSELDGKIRILTKGIGHGLGLSQYGANELAKQGKNYQDILKYYYQDVTLEHW
nr:SpoIID/LytB domain-containing protein [Eubacterium ramulus]